MSRILSIFGLVSCAAVGVACNIINTKALNLDYKFDVINYQQKFDEATGTVPSIPCGGSVGDTCGALSAAVSDPSAEISCDATTSTCIATLQLRLSYTVDLSQQSTFPPQAIQYGVRAVTLDRVDYWIQQNTLNTATPKIDIFVAASAAADERDPSAVPIGSIASLPSLSGACADTVDTDGDSAAMGAQVCKVPLVNEGKTALQNFVVDYKTPFKLLAHGTVVVKAGDPIPQGNLAFSVRPSVGLSILNGI